MAQVVIIDLRTGGEVYSSVVYRTRTFRRDIIKRVWVTWLKVCNPPSCPECRSRMGICRRRVNSQTWWGCRNDAMHHKKEPIWVPWDAMLPDKALQFVQELRDERRAYEAAVHAEQ
jgi:hypothetical protein